VGGGIRLPCSQCFFSVYWSTGTAFEKPLHYQGEKSTMATMKLSKADLTRAASRAESLKSRISSLRKKTEKTTERVVHTVEVSAGAFTAGVIQGRGGIDILNVPLELALGAGLNLAGYLGLGGKMSEHLNGFGDGFLAGYATQMGFAVGKTWGTKEIKEDKKDGSGTGVLEDAYKRGAIGRGEAAISDTEYRKAVIDAVSAE
jgi:hypothetical protein